MSLEENVQGTVAGLGVFLIPFGTGVITGMGRAQGYEFSHALLPLVHILPPLGGLIGGGVGLGSVKGAIYGGACATALMFGGQLLGYGMGQFLKNQ